MGNKFYGGGGGSKKKKAIKGLLILFGVIIGLLLLAAVVEEPVVSSGTFYQSCDAGRYIAHIPVKSNGWGYATNVDVYVAVDVPSAKDIVKYLSAPYDEITFDPDEWAKIGFGDLDPIGYHLYRFRLGSLGPRWWVWNNSAEVKLAIEFVASNGTIKHTTVQFSDIKIVYNGIRGGGTVDVGPKTLKMT